MLQEALEGVLFLGLLGFLTAGIAYHYGFFNKPSFPRAKIQLMHLLAVFGIYFGFFFIIPLILHMLLPQGVSSAMTFQFFIASAMFISLMLYIRGDKSGAMAAAIKNPESKSSRLTDFGIGVLVWFVAFPWVGVAGQICDFLLEALYNFQSYEQVAVRYLKETLQSTPQMVIALISIIIIAPIVEEILFRGTLQQFLKKYFSVKTSIALTALVFACFHYSPTQDLGNFSLIPSLFIFACFLGYTYERQGSIFASIGLHLSFNLASSFQILFFPESA